MNAMMWAMGFAAPLALSAGEPLMAQGGALVFSPQVEKAEPQEEAPSEQQQSVLPAQMTSDQFIQFFTLFSASPEMGIALAAVTGPMLEPGEPVENWRTQGIDVLAELGAMEGGLAGNLLRDADEPQGSVGDSHNACQRGIYMFRI